MVLLTMTSEMKFVCIVLTMELRCTYVAGYVVHGSIVHFDNYALTLIYE